MTAEDSRDVRSRDEARGTRRRRRVLTASAAASVTLAADFMVLKWVVPAADEWSGNPLMSLGYIVTFFVAFSNLVIALAIVAYLLHKESYPSDRWK